MSKLSFVEERICGADEPKESPYKIFKCKCGRRIMREENQKVGICNVCQPIKKKIDGLRGWVYDQKDYKIQDYE